MDVAPVSMATIWPIIKDRAFFSMQSTIIPSNILEKFSLFLKHLFHLIECKVHHKFGQNWTMVKVKVTELTKIT